MYRAPFLHLPGAPNSLNPPLAGSIVWKSAYLALFQACASMDKTTHNDVKIRAFGELPHKHSLKSVIKS